MAGSGAADADLIVVGAGLAGLVAATEAAQAGLRVLVLDQEGPASLGGQAHWSFGGLFLVDTPEQRRLGVRDSEELAWQDWRATAGWDRQDDDLPARWAEAFVHFAAGEARPWLRGLGVAFVPLVGWAERGAGTASGPGNSVPRFHIAWGTGPGVLAPFLVRAAQLRDAGRIEIRFRHRVDALTLSGGTVTGVCGTLLENDAAPRGVTSSRASVGEFELHASAVLVASGGIGGNPELVARNWPARLGAPPEDALIGVPSHVDGRMLGIAAEAGARLSHQDRMWHYTEGLGAAERVWPRHGIRILPGPSSLWLDATGRRLPVPLFPGFDTLATLAHLRATGRDHSWFVLTRRILEKEFALSGSDQNPDLAARDLRGFANRLRPGTPAPLAALLRHGEDLVQARDVATLAARMNRLVGEPLIDATELERVVVERDREIANPYTKDLQVTALRAARRYPGDRLLRVATPHRLLDPKAGPLVAARLRVVTRKTLGGIRTDLDGRALGGDDAPVAGLWAAGEVAGFGGGGMHGYASLEGTFLGGCLYSGRVAGRAVAAAVR